MTAPQLEELRALSDEASPDWTVADRGITRMVRERGNGPQIGNFILDEDAEFAVAAVNAVRAALNEEPVEREAQNEPTIIKRRESGSDRNRRGATRRSPSPAALSSPDPVLSEERLAAACRTVWPWCSEGQSRLWAEALLNAAALSKHNHPL